ncbi:MAG: hypothetical protein M1818_006860 [Claussenomyces sp. TS43310]|nr:MAG: hypothetical protein M1818_006860 [Claussenomyces sp. TS43310]
MGGRKVPSTISDLRTSTARIRKSVGEEDILRPVSNKQHPDDWPCFLLKDAIIYRKDGKSIGNLLNAELDGPFTIYGTLEVGEGLDHLQLHATDGNAVRLQNVVGFSMADDPITLWASGRSGWFEIRPRRSYQSIFDQMVEGIKLYYFLVDAYSGNRKRKKMAGARQHMSVDRLFDNFLQQSAVQTTKHEVAQLFTNQATFLLSQMRKQGVNVNWSRTTIFRWLKATCPEIYQRYEPNAAQEEPSPGGGEGTTTYSSALVDQTEDTTSESRSRISAIESRRAAEIIFHTMRELDESKTLRKHHMTILKLSRILYERFELPNEEVAQEVLKCHAEPLALLLEATWGTSPIHRRIIEISESTVNASADVQLTASRTKLVPRKSQIKVLPDANVSAPDSQFKSTSASHNRHERRFRDTGYDNDTPNTEPKSSTAGGHIIDLTDETVSWNGERTQTVRKSVRRDQVLGSRSTSIVVGVKQTDSSQPAASGGEYTPSKSVLSMDKPSQRSSRSGKGASLRLIGTSPNRDTSSTVLSEDGSHPTRSSKRQKRAPSSSLSDEETNVDDNSYNDDRDTNKATDNVPEAKMMLELAEEELPSAIPQGPGGLWLCQREGCEYEVPNADKPKGRAKVQAHFLEHADEIEAREQLVLQESRPHLPIDNLLEKIRSMGQAARIAEQQMINGRAVPPKINRRLAL